MTAPVPIVDIPERNAPNANAREVRWSDVGVVLTFEGDNGSASWPRYLADFVTAVEHFPSRIWQAIDVERIHVRIGNEIRNAHMMPNGLGRDAYPRVPLLRASRRRLNTTALSATNPRGVSRIMGISRIGLIVHELTHLIAGREVNDDEDVTTRPGVALLPQFSRASLVEWVYTASWNGVRTEGPPSIMGYVYGGSWDRLDALTQDAFSDWAYAHPDVDHPIDRVDADGTPAEPVVEIAPMPPPVTDYEDAEIDEIDDLDPPVGVEDDLDETPDDGAALPVEIVFSATDGDPAVIYRGNVRRVP